MTGGGSQFRQPVPDAINRTHDCIIFDLFGVIISFDDNIVYRRIAKYCTDPNVAFRDMKGLVSLDELIRGRLSLEQLYSKLVAEYGLSLEFRQFEEAWLAPYTAAMPGMADLLSLLAKSHRLVLLSNVDRYYWETVKTIHRELNFLATHLLSWELGMAKPDTAIFQRALEAAGTSPARCLFVDDKAENIDAAGELGICGHLFRTRDELFTLLPADVRMRSAQRPLPPEPARERGSRR